MAAIIQIGFLKNTQITQVGNMAIGSSITLNRNQTKQNNAHLVVGDSLVWSPIHSHINHDNDWIDCFSMDGSNYITSSQS